jgi:hypothetical protein
MRREPRRHAHGDDAVVVGGREMARKEHEGLVLQRLQADFFAVRQRMRSGYLKDESARYKAVIEQARIQTECSLGLRGIWMWVGE